MKELNLTEGEWKIYTNTAGVRQIGTDSCGHGAHPEIASMNQAYFNDETREANAQAICKAVNNTYHKGIDPEAAEDMKEALKECNEFLDWTDFKNFDGEDWAKVSELIEKVEEALKKAGVNLNENPE